MKAYFDEYIKPLVDDLDEKLGIHHIAVLDRSYDLHFTVTEDGLKCAHTNVTIDRACCSSVGSSGYIECGCGGQDSIFCSDCKNSDMTDEDIENLIGNHYGDEE